MRMTTTSFWEFVAPYVGMVMLPLVAVIIAFLKLTLNKLERLSVKLEGVDATTKITRSQTDGIITHLQDTITRKDSEAEQLAQVTNLKTQIAAAKASDREEPKV